MKWTNEALQIRKNVVPDNKVKIIDDLSEAIAKQKNHRHVIAEDIFEAIKRLLALH